MEIDISPYEFVERLITRKPDKKEGTTSLLESMKVKGILWIGQTKPK